MEKEIEVCKVCGSEKIEHTYSTHTEATQDNNGNPIPVEVVDGDIVYCYECKEYVDTKIIKVDIEEAPQKEQEKDLPF